MPSLGLVRRVDSAKFSAIAVVASFIAAISQKWQIRYKLFTFCCLIIEAINKSVRAKLLVILREFALCSGHRFRKVAITLNLLYL